ncbi:hypothetical protein CXQ80_11045 [Pseudomonas sp. 02C 26]|uniref:Wadjet anti-phage system protein JetD domain-containing protein n=1 Tax=Pseudomonas sp. 02C 26 TaxID=2054914 RepID=UPI000C6E5018|nr:Wadjet anti-phage system protein JetD domain-containing protein [Pseudomonas sp. 02C 26]AUF96325.1 hypothetical protein CXQ80_11045 [Pseudomonas sp. 02C 26]
MKSPEDLRRRLIQLWLKPGVRSKQLRNPASWPWELNIGKPPPRCFNTRISDVQRHVEAWRAVKVGKVEWSSVSYRNGADTILVPSKWCLRTPSEWVAATEDRPTIEEFEALGYLVERVPEHFHTLLIQRRLLWKGKPSEEVLQAAVLASQLTPGCAKGQPLRLLSGYGVDTKFFERNELLLRKFLDVLFEGEASEQSLCGFLDAYDETNHWVLVVPLEDGLLPFKRQRVTTSELAQVELPGCRLLVVENEKSYHQLLEVPGTVAVLGCGLDLAWLDSPKHREKAVAYWGDMDTWGLRMLARARVKHGKVTSMLMSKALFDEYKRGSAVRELVRAQDTAPPGLTASESELFCHLVKSSKGRLEQEFIPRQLVHKALQTWVSSSSNP